MREEGGTYLTVFDVDADLMQGVEALVRAGGDDEAREVLQTGDMEKLVALTRANKFTGYGVTFVREVALSPQGELKPIFSLNLGELAAGVDDEFVASLLADFKDADISYSVFSDTTSELEWWTPEAGNAPRRLPCTKDGRPCITFEEVLEIMQSHPEAAQDLLAKFPGLPALSIESAAVEMDISL